MKLKYLTVEEAEFLVSELTQVMLSQMNTGVPHKESIAACEKYLKTVPPHHVPTVLSHAIYHLANLQTNQRN